MAECIQIEEGCRLPVFYLTLLAVYEATASSDFQKMSSHRINQLHFDEMTNDRYVMREETAFTHIIILLYSSASDTTNPNSNTRRYSLLKTHKAEQETTLINC